MTEKQSYHEKREVVELAKVIVDSKLGSYYRQRHRDIARPGHRHQDPYPLILHGHSHYIHFYIGDLMASWHAHFNNSVFGTE